MLIAVVLLSLAAVLVIGHLVGRRLASHVACAPGHGRDVMPTLPGYSVARGSAARRWDQRVRAAEDRLLRHFSGGVEGAKASVLASAIDEDLMVVEAALERIRAEVPCRLRVTRAGELLHDFEASDVATLVGRRRRGTPFRLLLLALSAMANIGTVWPVLMVLILAVATLEFLIWMPSGKAIYLGLASLLVIVVVLGGAWAGSHFVRFALTPLARGPRLTPAHDKVTSERLQQKLENLRPKQNWFLGFFSYKVSQPMGARAILGPGAGRVPVERPTKSERRGWLGAGGGRAGGRGGGGGGGRGGGGGGGSGDGAAGAVQAILIVAFILIVLACLFTLAVWARGLYVAIREREDSEVDQIGPSEWVDLVDEADWYERFIPTNDLVARSTSSLRRALSHRRPVDRMLAERIVSRMRQRDETMIAPTRIALDEGLDPAEVVEIGSRLCRRFNGRMLVSEDGELAFDLGPAMDAPQKEVAPAFYEYLYQTCPSPTRVGRGTYRSGPDPKHISRLAYQPLDGLPVNLVGLNHIHLRAADLLVTGSFMMFVSAVYLLMVLEPSMLVGSMLAIPAEIASVVWSLGWLICAVLLAFTAGTVALCTSVRYVSKATARQGIQRDIRRALGTALGEACDHGRNGLAVAPWVDRLELIFSDTGARIDRDFVDKECLGLILDLGLEDEIRYTEEGQVGSVGIGPIRDRLESIKAARFSTIMGVDGSDGADRAQGHDDEVVFDSRIVPEQVIALT